MSYYPRESRGGCMEAISRCCRNAYVYPLDSRKVLFGVGAIAGIILVSVVWSSLSSSNSGGNSEPLKGRTVLEESPLIVGSNYFSSSLRDLAHNNVTSVNFNQNLKNDSVFGNATCAHCQTDLPRLKSGLVGTQIWSISVPCNAMYKDAVSLTLEQLDAITRLVDSYPDSLTLIKSSADVNGVFKSKQVGSLLAVSSGHSVDGRPAVMRSLHSLGIRVMALTSNCSNAWAASYTEEKDTGLSDFGKAMVREMNRLGILIDLSEASYKTQLDVLSVTKAPVIFSHAAAFGVNNDSRNVKDDVLEKLKTNKGVLMVTFAQKYLSSNITNATIDKVIEHINHVKDKVGVSGVGIGAEFDAPGLTYPSLMNDVSTFPILFDQLANSWTNRDDLKKLAGGNFIRVLEAAEQFAKASAALPVDEIYTLQINSSCYSDYETRQNVINTTTTTTTIPVSTAVPQTTPEKTTETTVSTTATTPTVPTTPTTSTVPTTPTTQKPLKKLKTP